MMYKNIGQRIKELAQLNAGIGIAVSIVIGVKFIFSGIENAPEIVLGVLIILLGSFLSWISSFVLYGFGQLVDNSDLIAEKIMNEVQE